VRRCVWSRNIKNRCATHIYDISSLRINDLNTLPYEAPVEHLVRFFLPLGKEQIQFSTLFKEERIAWTRHIFKVFMRWKCWYSQHQKIGVLVGNDVQCSLSFGNESPRFWLGTDVSEALASKFSVTWTRKKWVMYLEG